MNYYFTTTIKGNFEAVEAKVIALLKEEGFGIITQIDMRKTFEEKLNIVINKYKILGACNPSYAYKALQIENKIGTMLPCNFIIQEMSTGMIEVSAINPLLSMQAVENDQLNMVSRSVSEKIENVIKLMAAKKQLN